jgi:hypothetical protein
MVLISVVKMETRVSREDLGNDNCLTDGVRIEGFDGWQGHYRKKRLLGEMCPADNQRPPAEQGV